MVGKYLLFILVVVLHSNAEVRDRYTYVTDSSNANMNNLDSLNTSGMTRKPNRFQDYFKKSTRGQRVKIQLYYECLCPDCRSFDSGQFKDTVVALASSLDIRVYPYGNAQTEEHGGRVQFSCQHGPAECYGNKLHACALDELQNVTAAVLLNSCMMDSTQAGKGSDDAAADVCARAMGINSAPIKSCAKGERGTALLKYYGVESKMAGFDSVPYILVDGVQNRGDDFKRDVCKAFTYPPPACDGLL